MEGTLFPSQPVYLIPVNRLTQPNSQVKFNSTTLPPPHQSRAPPFPIYSLLQHILSLSLPPNTPHKLKPLNLPHQTNGSLFSLQILTDSTSKQHQMKKPTSVLAPHFEDGARVVNKIFNLAYQIRSEQKQTETNSRRSPWI
ncbi:hypothetical protein COP2_022013 [Malus domestica]|uniref:Uncharacterized protein n=1 Tax=Malus domestica TaxID=3750 RepID=A0A498HLR4_MALDO|nr:hypothetical protein DVH24_025151 [Malus domestica]